MGAPDQPAKELHDGESGSLDVEQLKLRILKTVQRRAQAEGFSVDAALPDAKFGVLPAADPPAGVDRPASAGAIASRLADLELCADLGMELPQMSRLPRPLRLLARLFARGVRLCAGFLIREQTQYNYAVLQVLRQLGLAVSRNMADMERELAVTREHLQRLEQCLLGIEKQGKQRPDTEPSGGEQSAAA